VKIVRDLIKVRSVRSKMLENDIAYVRVAQFQERTASDLVNQLAKLGQSKPPKGLILDLRNDPGCLLDAAIGVSSTFLQPTALVVSTKGRTASATREYFAKPSDYMRHFSEGDPLSSAPNWTRTVPMVVLVNVGSASASEIVAGALQDHGRAKVLGNRTFGKGSVQSVLPLGEDTGIKLTTARYYTPKGRSIQVTGVEPDIAVDDTAQGNLFRLPREADLAHHLENAMAAPEVVTPVDDEQGERPEPKMVAFGGADDFQLQQAINLLEGRSVSKSGPRTTAARKEPASASQTAAGKEESKAEKKTEQPAQTVPPERIERFRLTPDGLVPINE